MARVMVVDDDRTVREVSAAYLRASGHQIVEAGTGEQALELIATNPADLLVLDIMLPGISGLEVAARLRKDCDVPIIMLSALGGEADRVAGLELGVDDYIGKPFSPRELALRVESVLRRSSAPAGAVWHVLRDDDLVLDAAQRQATLDGVDLGLTQREFDLLQFFMSHPDTAYSREDLLRHVWGWAVGDNSTVTVHVRRLREKVEPDPARPTRLLTVWGKGYRWAQRS
ncbi:response regulator transcription factor [Rudaeicoccus suwonensis]|uniref:DNA-binding response OmpR family regulator n=1 Tax=Rudaeicoccus suwonensis TaxID=657409 RepID=A0A561E9H2_9MICO|nr:response regulator transcription factor [Rudaeicoccus suwonensis]TWE12265.1 DNA-binding response OmpR family regulator [Rudaeicoccus suwonensis]